MELVTEARHAGLADLHEILTTQRARRLDVVAHPDTFSVSNGRLLVAGHEPLLTDDGVVQINGVYRPTDVFDDGITEKLGVNRQWLRWLRDNRPDLFDATVNGLLHGGAGDDGTDYPGYAKPLFLRLFRGDEGGDGVARALLSQRYGRIDNLDILVSALDGVRQAGVSVEVDEADLSERNMFVRVRSPEVAALAPDLLENYRNPHPGGGILPWEVDAHGWGTPENLRRAAEREGMGYSQGQEPVVFAGITIRNSEIGQGGFRILPELRIRVCKNGAVIDAKAFKVIHVGEKLDEGVVAWSQATLDKQLALVTSQTKDAVTTFLSPEYLQHGIEAVGEHYGVEVPEPAKVIEAVTSETVVPKAMADEILGFFTRGGQATAGGVMQAVTAAAQHLDNADLAHQIEEEALNILAVAAKAAKAS